MRYLRVMFQPVIDLESATPDDDPSFAVFDHGKSVGHTSAAFEFRHADQIDPAQVGPAQVGPAQVGPEQDGPGQVGPAQIGMVQFCTGQPGSSQIGIRKRYPFHDSIFDGLADAVEFFWQYLAAVYSIDSMFHVYTPSQLQ